jgi:hypothetical protein
MRTITQRIPNLLLGISQQEDIRKFPGQLVKADNVFPDFTLGLLKRPGGKYVSNLQEASTAGRWFSIIRDTDEKYVCQYDDNIFRIWSLSDGSPRVVKMGTPGSNGIPSACNYTDVKSDLDTYNTAVDNTKTKLATLKEKQKNYAIVKAGQDSTLTSTFKTKTAYPVGSINDALETGAQQDSAGNVTFLKDGVVVTGADYAKGKERTNEQPLLAAEGFRFFELLETIAATHSSADLTTAETELTTAETNYSNAETAEATALTNYQNELADCDISSIPAGDYLNGATADDLEFLTINDYTFVLNKQKTAAMKTTTTAAAANEAFISINVVAYNSSYKVKVNNTTITHNTPTNVDPSNPTQNDANTIATAIRNAINALSGFSATVVGPGIYVSGNSAFTISASGGSQEDAITVFQDAVISAAKLPAQAKNGYIVAIVNSADLTADDMYVKFETSGTATFGPGTWVETTKPGITFELDEDTLPHQLIRNADGTFTFSSVSWNDRVVGDTDSNPDPSFIGKKISNLFFYRNRLGFLAGDSVVLSKAGDFFNFFSTSAVQATGDDPIDISASSTRPAVLKYARSTSAGLVLFGERDQFLLSTDGDVLSPTTAKVNTLSSFECDANVEAESLGTTMAFVAKTPLFTRIYELGDIDTERAPAMGELTTIVPELIPEDADNMIASSTQSMLSIATSSKNKVFQYRFLSQRDSRVSSWYTWTLTGNVLDQFFDQSTYYAVVTYGSEVFIQSFDLTQSNESGFLTLPTGEKTDVCLDNWYENPEASYSSADDETTVTLPYSHYSDGKLAAIDTDNGTVYYPTVSSGEFTIDGDVRGDNLIIGYIYDMDVELPKFYRKTVSQGSSEADFTSDLIIHRIKVSTGLSGPIKYKIDIEGKELFTKEIDVAVPYLYNLDNVNLSASAVHEIPIYQRNENLKINIVGDTPFPVSLLALNWEGRLGNKFYARTA